MGRVMKATFASYDRVVLLGEDMARLIAERRGVARERMSIIPNWGDVDAIAAVDLSASPLAGDLGARDKTIIQYSGNIGRPPDIELVPIGRASCRERVCQYV